MEKNFWYITFFRNVVIRCPINLKCFEKYAVNDVFRKIAFCDRTCDSVFSYVVIEVVILFLMLSVIVFVIEIVIEFVTDNL